MNDYQDVNGNKCENFILLLYVEDNMALRFGHVASISTEDKQ